MKLHKLLYQILINGKYVATNTEYHVWHYRSLSFKLYYHRSGAVYKIESGVV